ncbi:tetratricopeptide repeat protein [Legionella bononiensis]|uniref:Tetratricopeptide repeat protein n=1 Tax=Legionella bononiensis TaxID=2793102 RepID=A0ABS1W8A3_9GAMM|nr:tetratricopeptide repeat protein [Legionella bononiensis]MBL7479916.1 tetratricopeptide repeat protein [Legionella bononiensis]MBL7525569.1 tetratricopeptide repeat protein [Legionella bononiensis]MBL7561753.1 tetratricopeptide repeat protein [Legionella bononiensis]
MNEWWLISILVLITIAASILIIYPLKCNLLTRIVLVPIIFLMASTSYYFWGGFAEWQDYIHQNESRQRAQQVLKSIKSPQELIDKLRAKLDDSPKSAKGWYLLGRLYTSQNETNNAAQAFAKAHRLNPEDEQYAVNYAHSLWLMNNQQFSAEIIDVFKNLLNKNPNQPDALAMLAMNAYMSHDYKDAIAYWQRLLVMAPEQSEESQSIRKAIAKAQDQINLGSK